MSATASTGLPHSGASAAPPSSTNLQPTGLSNSAARPAVTSPSSSSPAPVPVAVSSTLAPPVHVTVSSTTQAPSTIPTAGAHAAVPGPTQAGPQGHNATVAQSSAPAIRIHRSYWKSSKVLLVEWRWELFTWMLGSFALASTLAILVIYDNSSLDEWHSPVQISAIVAILSQTAQSALIVGIATTLGQAKWHWLKNTWSKIEIERFDEASRGPEGSLKLLMLAILHLRKRLFSLHL